MRRRTDFVHNNCNGKRRRLGDPQPQNRHANSNGAVAIPAVPQAAFVQGQPVQRAALSVTPQVLNRAQVLPLATIAPQPVSIRGAAPEARARPPAAALEQPVVAKAPPPPAPVMPALNAAPGK